MLRLGKVLPTAVCAIPPLPCISPCKVRFTAQKVPWEEEKFIEDLPGNPCDAAKDNAEEAHLRTLLLLAGSPHSLMR